MAKLIISFIFLSNISFAESMKFNYKNEDLPKIVEDYAKTTKQKFVFEGGVRGKATILTDGTVATDEAFNLMSSALAVNGYGITKHGDTFVIMSARNIQRSLVEVTTEVPTLKPERMVTFIYTAKNISVNSLNRDIRILTSKDGEMTVEGKANRLIFTDWSSNINRIAQLMNMLDKPADPSVSKYAKENADAADKWRERRIEKMKAEKAPEMPPPAKTN